MHQCDWFKVYDIIEALHERFVKNDRENSQQEAVQFAQAINSFLVEEGIGWQLLDGQVVNRGDEAFESVVNQATSALETSDRPTAARHLQEALQDLSRRPIPISPARYITQWEHLKR